MRTSNEQLERKHMNRITTHPGEILREEYLVPLKMSARQLAKAIGVPANRISEIAREKRDITPPTAIRLGKFFDTTAKFWMNLQTAHDISKSMELEAKEIKRIKTFRVIKTKMLGRIKGASQEKAKNIA